MKPKGAPFSEYEVGYVVKHYADLGPTRVADDLGRPKSSIIQLARRLKLAATPRHRYDTNELDRLIRERYATEGAAAIADEMGIPRITVNSRAASIGVRREGHSYRKLTERDVARIKRLLAAGENGAEIARHYGVSRAAISAIRRGVAWAWVEAENTRETRGQKA